MSTATNNSVTQNVTQNDTRDDTTQQGEYRDGAILQIEGLSCERGERRLFEAFALALCPGNGVRIEGPNGSGKTSLLRIIAGLSDRYEGRLSWRGIDVRNRRQGRGVMAMESLYIGHLPGVKPLLTPAENLSWWSALHLGRQPGSDAVRKALTQVGLAHDCDTPCHQLSAGQQRRVALARLYLSDHQLWILDEPFTAIDKQGVAELELHIGGHLQRGGMAIVTTHQTMQINGFSQCSLSDFAPASERCA